MIIDAISSTIMFFSQNVELTFTYADLALINIFILIMGILVIAMRSQIEFIRCRVKDLELTSYTYRKMYYDICKRIHAGNIK